MGFKQRLFITMMALLALLQVASASVVYFASRENVKTAAIDQFRIGERLFINKFRSRSEYLNRAVKTVASDSGFQKAIVDDERDQLRTNLIAQSKRIGANLGVFISRDHSVFIASQNLNRADHDILFYGDSSPEFGQVAQISLGLYQFVWSRVERSSGQLLGWAAMGFAIDNPLASEMSRLSQLDVSFVWQQNSKSSLVASSSHSQPHRKLISYEAPRYQPGFSQQVSNTLWMISQELPSKELSIVLSKNISPQLQAFNHRWLQMQGIFLLALVAAGLIARWQAKNLTKPLSQLLDASKRIADGHYGENLEIHRNDEIGALALSFEKMKTAIAGREQDIRFQAEHDDLTGLLNRSAFVNTLTVTANDQQLKPITIAIININNFSQINDTLGHDIGDKLLRQLASRLRASFEHNNCARLGADQFTVFELHSQQSDDNHLIDRASALFSEPFHIGELSISLKCTLGISRYPEQSKSAQDLVRTAEIAMFEAKRQKLDACHYHADMDRNSVAQLKLMSELPNAIEDGHLELFYQPTLSLEDEHPKLVKVECLTRWQHPEQGLIPPDHFIHLAEQSGAITQLTLWAIDQALRQCQRWRDQGQTIGVAVNISAVDLFQSQLEQYVPERLAHYQLPPYCLTLEVTESEVMQDPEYAQNVLEALATAGVRLSIDDYGTGFSSLAQMKKLPIHELKIDKSFVIDYDDDQSDQLIVQSTIELGHALGLKVVAEGVESADTLNALAAQNCDFAQGFHIAKPLSALQFEHWLSTTIYPNHTSQSLNSFES